MKLIQFLMIASLLLSQILITSQTYEQDTDLASDYYKKGIELKNSYNLDSAEFYLLKAAELFKKHEVWENYLIVSNEAGTILLARGNIKTAIDYYNVQIGIAVEKFGQSNEYLANLYNNLGRAYFFKGDAYAALDLYDKALAIRISMGDKESIFASNLFNDMGNASLPATFSEFLALFYNNRAPVQTHLARYMHSPCR